ncbi:uncharacterized protein si:dkey-284p5.3 isoform X2 [Hypanus sabinus]|uniref:uncharacterized protein si:dkey-284p5.3 isoform X2 n=1 Tax=Hypanus sabinus TaxID=79690 RepID=UPI0028C45394|nr:uncharacterized protein si:dkey-284p5.3 isoform X2 [Hypanus sabinus]
MGCSSSTQTQLQDCNRPSSKQERNGASKRAPDVNGPITNEGETVSDQAQLLEPRAADPGPDEVVTNEPSPSEDGMRLTTDTEDSSAHAGVTAEERAASAAPVEETALSGADDIEKVLPLEDRIEGETGEKMESKTAINANDEKENELETSEDLLPPEPIEPITKNKED